MTADEALKRREDRLKDFVEKHQGDFSDRERDAIGVYAQMLFLKRLMLELEDGNGE